MFSLPMRAAKDELRQEMRDRRLALDEQHTRACAEAAARHLAKLPAFQAARVVGLYAPIRGEIDSTPLVRELAARKKRACYPRLTPGRRLLAFHEQADPARLVGGSMGILEPTDADPEVELESVDLFVVPGLAFDEQGGRLGWGRAYYDTTLSAAPGALRVGYAYELQVLERVPQADTDVRMDVLCTERGARETGARPLPPRRNR